MSRTLIIPIEGEVINLHYKKLPALDATGVKGLWHLASNQVFFSSRAYDNMIDAVKLGETAIREVMNGVVKVTDGNSYTWQDNEQVRNLELPV